MKKLWFLLSLSVLFFLMWCWKQELIQDIQQSQEGIETKHVVRNVDRWMTLDEVKKAENIKESDIVEEYDENWISWISIKWDLLWKDAEIVYMFYDSKLISVWYWVQWIIKDDYIRIRRILWKKYWNENYPEDYFDQLRKEIQEATTEEELDEIQKKSDEYFYVNDEIWNTTSLDWMEDDFYLRQWYLFMHHTFETDDWTFVWIEAWNINWNGADLVIQYISWKWKEIMWLNIEKEIDKNL